MTPRSILCIFAISCFLLFGCSDLPPQAEFLGRYTPVSINDLKYDPAKYFNTSVSVIGYFGTYPGFGTLFPTRLMERLHNEPTALPVFDSSEDKILSFGRVCSPGYVHIVGKFGMIEILGRYGITRIDEIHFMGVDENSGEYRQCYPIE